MDTPFRNDVDALKTRLTSLDEELAALRTKAQEYEAVRERLAHIEREHEELRREIDARTTRRAVPYLDTLRIASPCHESWDGMIGDDKTRFCAKCQKNVHNISEMTRDEAGAFLESVAGAACVRMYRRRDGTVLTADCPVGVRKQRVKRLFLATIGGGLAAGAVAFWAYEETMVMGEIPPAPSVAESGAITLPEHPQFATPPPRHAGPPPGSEGIMGDSRSPAPEPQKSTSHPPAKPPAPAKDRLGF